MTPICSDIIDPYISDDDTEIYLYTMNPEIISSDSYTMTNTSIRQLDYGIDFSAFREKYKVGVDY